MPRLLTLFFAATTALGAELPAGPMPEIDGAWSAGEWEIAHVLKLPQGEARLRTAGRTLCLAVRMDKPYAGEKIEFYVGTRSGSAYCIHALHPAVHVPRVPFLPVPAVLKKQGKWSERAEADFRDPYGARFRCRVLAKGETSWSAEFAVAHEALNLPAGEESAFFVRVVRAFTEADKPLTVPPAQWSALALKLDEKAGLFETPDDDASNKFALGLFRSGPTIKVLERGFDQDSVAGLAELVGKEDFFGLWFRAHLLRRANRLSEARAALRALTDAMPMARELKPVRSERRQLLILTGDYQQLREQESGRWIDTVEAAWRQETALREQDKDLPRIVLETSRGAVTVELFTKDAPALTKTVTDWIEAGKCNEIEAAWATGGVGFAFTAPNPPEDARPSGRRAWRGTLALIHEKEGALRLILTTGHVHLYRSATAVGRIVEGQKVVDGLGAADSIRTARAP
ncbi:MAG: hypothetical protein ACYTHK_08210 [Planctomycetota bacterium]|jgi:hypothetical protein